MIKKVAAILLLLFFGCFYVFWQSPGLTGGDAGDLVAAAFLRGVPHPPGYPLYTFLGWLLTKLPLGTTIAYRVSFLSSVPAAFCVFLAFLIAGKLSGKRLISLISALSIAFNYLFWLQAEVQEVFALHLFFLFLTLYLCLLWREKPQSKLLCFLALVIGLEFSHHHTYVLILPALFYLFFLSKKTRVKRPVLSLKTTFLVVLCFLVGASFYFYVPWAAASDPVVNWGNVKNIRSLIGLITRADYGTFVAAKGLDFSFKKGILATIAFINILYQEFTLLGTILLLLGIIRLARSDRCLFVFSLTWFIFAGPAFQFYAAFPVSNLFSLATMERFYLLSYPIFLIWFVFGIKTAGEEITSLVVNSRPWRLLKMRKIFTCLLPGFFLFYPLFLLSMNLEKNNFRDFYYFDQFGERLLDSCPQNAVLIASGDAEVFATLYSHYVQGIRPDLMVISLYNPKPTVFYLDELSKFRFLFGGSSQAQRSLWIELRKYFSENNLTVCSSEEIRPSKDYISFPQGLVDIYTKSEKETDYELIFATNTQVWADYQPGFSSQDDPVLETYFNQSLVDAYYYRALSISQFFFAAGLYDKTSFWLDISLKFKPESTGPLRMDFLIDVIQKNCALAQKKLEEYELKMSGSRNWPLIKATYEQECRGEEGDFQEDQDTRSPIKDLLK